MGWSAPPPPVAPPGPLIDVGAGAVTAHAATGGGGAAGAAGGARGTEATVATFSGGWAEAEEACVPDIATVGLISGGGLANCAGTFKGGMEAAAEDLGTPFSSSDDVLEGPAFTGRDGTGFDRSAFPGNASFPATVVESTTILPSFSLSDSSSVASSCFCCRSGLYRGDRKCCSPSSLSSWNALVLMGLPLRLRLSPPEGGGGHVAFNRRLLGSALVVPPGA